MVECDAKKFSNYFQELEQSAKKLSCQEHEHRQQDNGWFTHTTMDWIVDLKSAKKQQK